MVVNNLKEVKEIQAPMEAKASGKGTVFAKNIYGNQEWELEIKDEDLTKHVFVQGAPGTGKTEWLKTTLLNHIKRGRGAIIYGDNGRDFLKIIPEERAGDVRIFDILNNSCDEIDIKELLDNNMILIFQNCECINSDLNIKAIRSRILGILEKIMDMLVSPTYKRNESKIKDPFLIVGEFSMLENNNISNIILKNLAKLSDYRIGMILVCQGVDGEEKFLNDLYNNIGTSIAFGCDYIDNTFIENWYGKIDGHSYLYRLPSRYGYCRLSINGKRSNTFSIYSLDSPEFDEVRYFSGTPGAGMSLR